MIFTESYEIDKFFDVDSNLTHIGTGQDLVNTIEQKCGTEIAEFVSTLIEDSNSLIKFDEENAELRCQLYDLQDEYDSLEMQYDELYEKSNEVCKELEELKQAEKLKQIKKNATVQRFKIPTKSGHKCPNCNHSINVLAPKCTNCGTVFIEEKHGYVQTYRLTYAPYDLAYKCSICGQVVDRWEAKCPNCCAILDGDGD